MSLAISKSTQFKINELVLVTKAGRIDISGIYTELNIFDSMFISVMSGNILINDSSGLSGKLLFDGSETLLVDISKDYDSDVGNFKKAFRIYKQTNRTNDRPGNETYKLHFVSDELIYSDQQRINQAYEKAYSEIAKSILIDYLRVPPNNLGGSYDTSFGLKKVVVPNLRPLEAIEWCAKRAVDSSNSPNFMFFQNITGYNFATLSNLLTQKDILDIKYQTKNLSSGNPISEMQGARDIEVITQNDNIERTRSGVNAGKFIGFDPMTGFISTKNIGYGDHYSNMKHGNETPNFSSTQSRDGTDNQSAFNSKKSVGVFGFARQYSEYIKKNDPSSLSKEEDVENWLFQRKAIIRNLMSKRLKVVMPGNFQLSSGFNVNVDVPMIGSKDKSNNDEDKSISGKYIIVATRHIIGYNKHETVIEVASSSSVNDFVPSGNSDQTTELLNY